MPRAFSLVDVFGVEPFSGNPLAVLADAEGLSVDEMQRIAAWTNLSETAFLFPPSDPDADYRVRIFTTSRELPFAGHPTLGSCHAWLAGGGRPRNPDLVVQQCGAGLIPIRSRPGKPLAFAAPPLIRGGAPSEADLAEALAVTRLDPADVIEARWIDNGPGWLGLLLASAEAVLAVEPAPVHDRTVSIGLVGAHPPGGDVQVELRALFTGPGGAMVEDPVTGSLNASVAQWLYDTGRATGPYAAAQGTRLGRNGRIAVDRDADGRVWVGGRTVTLLAGQEARG